MDLCFQLVDTREQLLHHQDACLALFERSFQKPLSPALWQWAYIDNVYGDPIVSLCYLADRLVGHYAVIPLLLQRGDQSIKACLSMTTMVDPSCQGRGLFTQQAQAVYQHAQHLGYQMVLGFPNQNSCHGFQKHLAWEIPAMDYVARVTKEQLMASEDVKNYCKKRNFFTVNIADDDYVDWRTSKPSQQYHKRQRHIFKKYHQEEDIIYLDLDNLEALPAHQPCQILLDSAIDDLKMYKQFDYQYGQRLFVDFSQPPTIKKDLILSDVF